MQNDAPREDRAQERAYAHRPPARAAAPYVILRGEDERAEQRRSAVWASRTERRERAMSCPDECGQKNVQDAGSLPNLGLRLGPGAFAAG